MRRSRSLRETTKRSRPCLLVSVRNLAEAQAAYEGGAAVIDIKEPRNGALAAASETTIAQIVEFIDGRRPVTAALGELRDRDGGLSSSAKTPSPSPSPESWGGGFLPILPGVAAVKVGLAGLGESDWREKLVTFANDFSLAAGGSRGSSPEKDSAGFRRRLGSGELVPAAYADWRAAGAPEPSAVLEAAAELGLSWVLLDTWDKSSGDLLEHCSESDLQALLIEARRQGLHVVLAGRLQGDSLRKVSQLRPDLVGVRSAVCTGGRDGQVRASLVELAVKSILRQDQPFDANFPRQDGGAI